MLGIPDLLLIALIVPIFFGLSGRFVHLRVHHFDYKDDPLPSCSMKVEGEQTLVHAYSFTQRMQSFVTNKRILVYTRTLFGGQHVSRYFPIDSLLTVHIGYRNPYDLVIYAILLLLAVVGDYAGALPQRSPSYGYTRSTEMLWIGGIAAVLLIALWYYLRSYTLVLKNFKSTFTILSRSEKELTKMLATIDPLRIK